MREKNAKKHGAQHQGRFKKYSIVGVFMLAAAGATYEAVDYTVDYLQEQHRLEVQTHSDEYLRLVMQGSAQNVELYAATLKYSGDFSQAELRSMRDRALLHAAAEGDERGMRIALQYGANIHARDAAGKTAGQLILTRNGIKSFEFTKNIYRQYSANLSFLHQDDALQYVLFEGADFDEDKDAVLALINDLDNADINLHQVGHTIRQQDDLTFSDFVNRTVSHKIIQHVADIWGGQDAAADLMWSYSHLHSYMDENDAPFIDVPTGSYRSRDFREYGKITYDAAFVGDNAFDPTLFVTERVTEARENDKKSKHLGHIYNTSYVSYGVMRRIDPDYGDKDDNLISARMRVGGGGSVDVTSVLEYARYNPVVLSESIGLVPSAGMTYESYYQSGAYAYPQYLRKLDADTEYVHYNSAGNDRDESCISVDGKSFCMQDSDISRQGENIVRVGAVTKKGRGYLVHDFSEERPAFCAVMPKRNDVQLYGTSFSAPAAAAVERRLLDIFGRSAAMPEGVVHDDVLMALMLSAQNDDVRDQRTGRDVPIYTSAGGLLMNDRCGAGVIRPQAAADVLSNMLLWTRYNQDVQPTQITQHNLDVRPALDAAKEGEYSYFVAVPESGVLTTLRAGMFFPINHRGAVTIQFGEEAPVVLDMAASGLSTDFRFAGKSVKAHDVITITTTKPLIQLGNPEHRGIYPFIDLKIAPHDSALAKAIEFYRAP
ncbi:MAG: hypothetical protein VX803_02305 [Pseudomonadota bacterium]|nr:hypothetical protein [Pseudomonadota bacterium]